MRCPGNPRARPPLTEQTCTGTHDLFYSHFVRPGLVDKGVAKALAALHRYREQADYSTAFRFDRDTGAEEIDRAAHIVAVARDLARRS